MPPVSREAVPGPVAALSPDAAGEALRRRMLWLLGLTFVHVFGEGGLALYESLRTGSLALLAFGLESIIEGGAAFLAVRHLRHLADEEEDHARRDQMLAQWIGISFLLLAAYTLGRGALEIFGGTLTPAADNPYPFYAPYDESKREAVNAFIRDGHAFDGVIDFAAAVSDPQDPLHWKPGLSADALHPSDAGAEIMGNAIDLALFR